MATVTIRGITYTLNSTKQFNAYTDATGYYTANGGTPTTSVKEGTAYWLTLYESGASYPYCISKWTHGGTDGWVNEKVFPYAKFKITLDKQGGSGGTSTVYSRYNVAIYSDSGTKTKITKVTVPTKTGYKVTFNANEGTCSTSALTSKITFGGYYTATGGSGTQCITSAGAVTSKFKTVFKATDVATTNKSVYAKWTYGSVTLPTPTRTGYTCLGWATSKTATAASYKCGSAYTPKAATTLYAVWQQDIYTISFDANGGEGTMTSISITGDSTVTLPLNTFYRSGYKFLGWSTSSIPTYSAASVNDSADTFYNDGATYTSKGKSETLYAQWAALDVYSIILDNNGANIAGTTAFYEQYNTGLYEDSACTTAISSIILPSKYVNVYLEEDYQATLANEEEGIEAEDETEPEVCNAAFGGYFDEDGTQEVTSSGTISSTSTTFSENSTLYASWTDGSLTLPTPTKEGFTCIGWSKEYDATTAEYACGSVITPTEDMTLYAIWQKNQAGSNIYIKENGIWKKGIAYIKSNGVWKQGDSYYKSNGIWKN